MRRSTPFLAALLALSVCHGIFGAPRAALAQNSPGPASVILVFGVGGVLTADGGLWSYLPDRDRWVTIDEAFALQDRETHILPLPIQADAIAQMSSFGFLVAKTGECWLYEIERDRWKKLPPPGR